MVKISTILAGLVPLVSTVHGYGLPGACSGTCTNTHDPSIVRRSDGTYFRFSTNGKVAVHSAPALTGPWTYHGAAIPSGSSINLPGNTDIWAPDVTLVGNTYYMFYSVSQFGSQNSAIGYATSNTLDVGTWTDHGATGIASTSAKAYNAIDANLVNNNGAYFITFGSFWRDIYQVAMTNPPTKVASGVSAYQVAYDPATTALEGSFLFKNGNYWYLFYSKGSCCGYDANRPAPGAEYKIMACRSTSPTGGFVDKNNVVCTNGGGSVVLESHDWVYGPGGQGVFQDPSLGPVLYYHYVDTRIGYSDGQKQFGWNTINFSSGWPVV